MKAARHGGTHNRAQARNPEQILAEFDRYTLYAGLILGAFFGLLIGWGL